MINRYYDGPYKLMVVLACDSGGGPFVGYSRAWFDSGTGTVLAGAVSGLDFSAGVPSPPPNCPGVVLSRPWGSTEGGATLVSCDPLTLTYALRYKGVSSANLSTTATVTLP